MLRKLLARVLTIAGKCCRSQVFAGCLVAAVIEQHEGNKLTYEPKGLSLGTLEQWIQLKLGDTGGSAQSHQVRVTAVLNTSEDNATNSRVGGVNSTYDFLCRGGMEEPDEKNDPRKLGAYAFTVFFKKTTNKDFQRPATCHLPRAFLDPSHPHHGTHCLMRHRIPQVPLLWGRIPKMPADWKEDAAMGAAVDSSDEGHAEWALYLLALFYPLHMTKEIELPPGRDLYTRVRAWWREEIVPGEYPSLNSLTRVLVL